MCLCVDMHTFVFPIQFMSFFQCPVYCHCFKLLSVQEMYLFLDFWLLKTCTEEIEMSSFLLPKI